MAPQALSHLLTQALGGCIGGPGGAKWEVRNHTGGGDPEYGALVPRAFATHINANMIVAGKPIALIKCDWVAA